MERDLDRRIAAIAAKQHAAFSRDQAKAAGFSRDTIRYRVRSGRWLHPARDVFWLAGGAATWRQVVMSAVLEAGPAAVASHASAAALLGASGFAEGPVEVESHERRNHRVTLGRLHQTSLLPPAHVVVLDGIPCTSLARTMFDLAAHLPLARLRRVVNAALQRSGLTAHALEGVLAVLGGSGRGGTTSIRTILDELGSEPVPTESELEDLVLAVLAAAGLELPDRQVTVGGAAAIGRVDFLYRWHRIVIEAQSRRFHGDWSAQQDDMARRAELAAAGFLVIEVTWWQLVHEPHVFVDRVRRALARAAA